MAPRDGETLEEALLPQSTKQDENSALSGTSSRPAGRWRRIGHGTAAVVLLLLLLVSSFSLLLLRALQPSSMNQVALKPIHPLHHGHVRYEATQQTPQDPSIVYSREFTAPCDFGILVFNVGPAPNREPWDYDVYQDAYVYSTNQNLCFFYPSYRGIQKADFSWWVSGDATSFNVKLGHTPQRISHRIVTPSDAKKAPTMPRAGDFVIIARHNFYTPSYYKALLSMVRKWKFSEESDEMVNRTTTTSNLNVLQELEQLMKDVTSNMTERDQASSDFVVGGMEIEW